MNLRDRILDALTRQGGITVGALAAQWVLPNSKEDAITHLERVKREVDALVEEGVAVKVRSYVHIKDLRRVT